MGNISVTHPHKNSPAWQRNLNHMKGLLDWNEEIFRDHLFFIMDLNDIARLDKKKYQRAIALL